MSSSGSRSHLEGNQAHRRGANDNALTKMQADLDETKRSLHTTIEGVLERGEKVDDLVAKTENLSVQSKLFSNTAKKTNTGNRKVGSVNRKKVRSYIVDATALDTEHKQRLLKNLNMRFVVGYTKYLKQNSHYMSHFAESTTKKTGIRSKIASTIQKLSETISCDHSFNKCLFVPSKEQQEVKNFINHNIPDVGISFENCKFIKRSSSLTDKVRRTFRKVFGIQFELLYINATATVDEYKFKVKDVWDVYQYIQERVVEEDS